MSDTNNIRKLMNIVNEGLFDFLDPMKAKFDRAENEYNRIKAEMDAAYAKDPSECQRVSDNLNNIDIVADSDGHGSVEYDFSKGVGAAKKAWLHANTAEGSAGRKYGELWIAHQ